jgi:hypothetical protein
MSSCDTVRGFLITEELRLRVKLDVAEWFSSAIGNDLLSVLGPRCQAPVVYDTVGPRLGHQRDQFFN